MDKEAQYSATELASITGLSHQTLRNWAEEFALLPPPPAAEFSEQAHYSAADLERIRTILGLLHQGIAIADVSRHLSSGRNPAHKPSWQLYIDKTLALVHHFQREPLAKLLDKLFTHCDLDSLQTNYLKPLAAELEYISEHQFGGGAERIFFESQLHADCLGRYRQVNMHAQGPLVLMLDNNMDPFNIQPLLLGLGLANHHFKVQMLFESCSLREVPYVIEQTQLPMARGIELVICHSSKATITPDTASEILLLAKTATVPVCLAGDWGDLIELAGKHPNLHCLIGSVRQQARQLGQIYQAAATQQHYPIAQASCKTAAKHLPH